MDTKLIKPKYWIRYISSRIKKNKNFMAVVVGQTGSGKSYSCLSIAEQLDSSFTIDRVVFDGYSFLQLINSGKLKSGDVIIFEEAGVGLSNKSWQSKTNKLFGFLGQTFRNMNLVVLFNSPDISFLDATMRKLFHAEFTTKGIDFSTNEVKLKSLIMQWNSRQGKMYYHRLKGLNKFGQFVPINTWRVIKPSQTLLEQYEAKKLEYTSNLNKRILKELTEDFKDKNQTNDKRTLTEKQQQVVDYLNDGLNVLEVANKMKVIKGMIYSHLTAIKNKGYIVHREFSGGKLDRYRIECQNNDAFS